MINIQEQEDRDFSYSTDAELDRDGATWDGYRSPEKAWLLSSRDVWYANPYYEGPWEPHPESHSSQEEYEALLEEHANPAPQPVVFVDPDEDNDCPF